MGILGNSTFQFIITSSLTLILGGISVWLSVRRNVQIPLTYETLFEKRVYPSDEEIKMLLETIHISSDDSRVQYLNFIIFKLWNSGKESVTFTEDKPLSIAFKRGATILACEEIETVPQDLDYTCRLEDEKILLAFPLLDTKETIVLRVLIPGYIYGFPEINVRVPGRKRIVRANNIRWSKEMLMIGLFVLCGAIYLFVSSRLPSSFPGPGVLCLFFGTEILCLVISWADRRLPPNHSMPPSYFLLSLVRGLPRLIPFGILAVLIYLWFGGQILVDAYLIFICLFTIIALWWMVYKGVTLLLKKMKIKYSTVLVGVLAGIPSLAFLALCVQIFLELFLYR